MAAKSSSKPIALFLAKNKSLSLTLSSHDHLFPWRSASWLLSTFVLAIRKRSRAQSSVSSQVQLVGPNNLIVGSFCFWARFSKSGQESAHQNTAVKCICVLFTKRVSVCLKRLNRSKHQLQSAYNCHNIQLLIFLSIIPVINFRLSAPKFYTSKIKSQKQQQRLH